MKSLQSFRSGGRFSEGFANFSGLEVSSVKGLYSFRSGGQFGEEFGGFPFSEELAGFQVWSQFSKELADFQVWRSVQ